VFLPVRPQYQETDRFNRMRKQFLNVTEMGKVMSVSLAELTQQIDDSGNALDRDVQEQCMLLIETTKEGLAKNDKLHNQNIGNFNFILKTHQPLIETMCNQQIQKDAAAIGEKAEL
jgi:hypothetical protein